MVELGAASAARDHAALVGLEDGLVGLNCNRDGANVESGLEIGLALDVDEATDGRGGGRALRSVAPAR